MNLKKNIRKFLYVIPIVIIGVLFFHKSSISNVFVGINRYKDPINDDFPDDNFYKCVVDAYNVQREDQPEASYSDILSDDQLSYIVELNCNGEGKEDSELIEDVTGIENLTSLVSADLSHNKITGIDVTGNTLLTSLDASYNNISNVDVSVDEHDNVSSVLNILNLSNNQISSIDISHNELLTQLNLSSNPLTEITLLNNGNLTTLDLSNDGLKNIDLKNNLNLVSLNLDGNLFSSVDLSHNTKLEDFSMSYNYSLGQNDSIICPMNGINFENNTELKTIVMKNSCLESVNLANTSKLETLDLYDNNLTSIVLSHSTNLKYLDLSYNYITSVDLMFNTKLENLNLSHNSLDALNVTNNVALKKLNVSTGTRYIENCYKCGNEISYINLSQNVNLEELNLFDNNLTTIDLSSNKKLVTLDLGNNYLTTIDLKENVNLENIRLDNISIEAALGYKGNRFSSLSFDDNIKLKNLDASFTYLDEIDLSENSDLEILRLYYNNLTSLDLSNKTNLQEVYVPGNQLRYLDLTGAEMINYDNAFSISHQGKRYSLLKNNYSGVEEDLVGFIHDQGYQDTYSTDIEVDGYEGDTSTWVFNYNVTWYEVTSEKYSSDLSEDTIIVTDNDIESFLSNFESENDTLYFTVNDGTDDLTTGSFEKNNTYKLGVYKVVTEEEPENYPLIREYDLLFAVSGVSLSSNSVELDLVNNKTHQLVATITPGYATNKQITWESSDTSVVTVSSDGLIASVGEGEATITVTTVDGQFTDTCTVTVLTPIRYSVVYKKTDGTVFKTEQFLPNENVMQEFADIFYVQGKKFIGWKYNGSIYSLNDELLMPNSDIELVAQYADVLFGNLEYDVHKDSGINYLSGIIPSTDVSGLDNFNLDSEYIVKVYSGQTLKTSGKVGTGDIIKVFVNDSQNYLVESYTAVVKGDNNGDGAADVSDVSNIYKYIKHSNDFDYLQLLASDVNGDGVIDVSDISNIYKFVKGKINF